MIFVTVGTQLNFPRLISAMDSISNNHNIDVVAQTADSGFYSENITSFDFITPTAFDAYFKDAEFIVGHAGIGTILSAIKHRKTLIAMPREFALGEHRNNHQIATAKRLEDREGLYIAHNKEDLEQLVIKTDKLPMTPESATSFSELTYYLKNKINEIIKDS